MCGFDLEHLLDSPTRVVKSYLSFICRTSAIFVTMRLQSPGMVTLAGWCVVVLITLSSSNADNTDYDYSDSASTNRSLSTSSNRRGRFFFDELFGLDTGVGLSNDDDDDDDEDGLNNVKTCNCGE